MEPTIKDARVAGAALSLVADIISQVFPTPVPVGSTIAMIGIPIVLYILISHRNA